MFGERTMAVAARIERIETCVAQLRTDLQRLDRKLDMHVDVLRAEIRQLGPEAVTRNAEGPGG